MPVGARWAVLATVSLLFAGALELVGLPAGFLLGPLGAGVILAARGGTVAVPRPLVIAAQAVIGCLIASAITPAVVGDFVDDWPVVFAIVGGSLASAVAIGWAMSR